MIRSAQPASSFPSGPLPSGAVTFLFSDIEGSTQRWEQDRAAMESALRRHDAVMRKAIETHAGRVFKTVGDAFCAAFTSAQHAVAAAVDAQRALAEEDFGAIGGLRVRMALHTGNAEQRDGDYFGPALNRVARLLAIGHGQQILVSGATAELVQGELAPDVVLRDLGAHRLKDLTRPERVYGIEASGLRSDFPQLRSLDSLPNNLPLQLTSFVGRDAEIDDVMRLVEKHRLVTLTGAGGIGKTRLSLQVAANFLEGREDGVWFVEFAPLSEPALVPGTIAKTLGITLPAHGDAADRLAAALKIKRLLAIFDNCEHLVDPIAGAAAAILRECPHISIVASSRQGLGISGEVTYRMPTLTVPDSEQAVELAPQEALRYGAIALFAERAKAADAGFELTADLVPSVAEICRRLDGIAFAIELAAARVRILKPSELRKRLDQRFRLLTGGSRDALPRQQTLRALIDWSHELLDENERRLLRRLGVFVSGFTLEGATAVAADDGADEFGVLDVLTSLIDKSLVVAELSGEKTRYRLLESTRAYAREKLQEAGETESIAERHFRQFLTLFTRTQAAFEETPRETTILDLEPELEEMRSALDWAEVHDPQGGAELLTSTGILLALKLANEGVVQGLRFTRLVSEARLLAKLWTSIAVCESGRFNAPRALDAGRQAVAYARDARDPFVLGDALVIAGRALCFMRQFAEAHAALDEAETVELTARQRLDLLTNRAALMALETELDPQTNRAVAFGSEADLKGMRAYEDLRARHRALGNERGYSRATMNLAESVHVRGDTKRAISLAREALAISERQRDSVSIEHINQNLAGYLLADGQRAEGRAAAEKVIRFYAKADPANAHVPVALEHFALACALEGDFKRAARLEGYVENALRLAGYEREYTELATQQPLLAALREHMSGPELDASLAAGSALTPEEAVAEALA